MPCHKLILSMLGVFQLAIATAFAGETMSERALPCSQSFLPINNNPPIEVNHASSHFAKGSQLVDVRKNVHKQVGIQLADDEWAYFSAEKSTLYLKAKSPNDEIVAIWLWQQFLDAVVMTQTTATIVQLEKNDLEPVTWSAEKIKQYPFKIIAQRTLTTRSGTPASLGKQPDRKVQDDGSKVDDSTSEPRDFFRVEPNIGPNKKVINLRFEIAQQIDNGHYIQLNSNFTLHNEIASYSEISSPAPQFTYLLILHCQLQDVRGRPLSEIKKSLLK